MNLPPSLAPAVASHLDKWLQREPEARLLEAFLPASQRALWTAWAALLVELDEAMFEVSDPLVARTKLAWWGEDLAAGAAARHPLAKHLQQLLAQQGIEVAASDWRRLALQALQLAVAEPSEPDDWHGLAEGVARVETRLFGRVSSAAAIAAQWRFARLQQALAQGRRERARLPQALAAAEQWAALPIGGSPAQDFWRAYASSCRADAGDGPLYRHWRQRHDALRLARLCAGQPLARALAPSPLRTLWQFWQAARQVRRLG